MISAVRFYTQCQSIKRLSGLLPESVKNVLRPAVLEISYRAAVRGKIANADSIASRLSETYQPVKCPLILISQVQRSGGSLLSQLFDGHRQLLAHPQELKIGSPFKYMWPPIDGALSTDKQFKILFEPTVLDMCQNGYAKGKKDLERKNFFFLPNVQRAIYRAAIAKLTGTPSQRDVLDAYFTSYFNAWLNLRSELKDAKYVTGFTPMLASRKENMKQFWDAYPDGYLISVLRSPFSWYPSAMRLGGGEKLGDLKKAVNWWNESTQAMIREKNDRPDRVIVLNFEDLLERTEKTMHHICVRTGLNFDPALLTPSFNGEPTGANTSFESLERGRVSSAPLKREKHLTAEHRRFLERHCQKLYEQAMAKAVEKV